MHSIDQVSLQNLCLRAARNGDVQLSIDERGGCIVFGGEKKASKFSMINSFNHENLQPFMQP